MNYLLRMIPRQPTLNLAEGLAALLVLPVAWTRVAIPITTRITIYIPHPIHRAMALVRTGLLSYRTLIIVINNVILLLQYCTLILYTRILVHTYLHRHFLGSPGFNVRQILLCQRKKPIGKMMESQGYLKIQIFLNIFMMFCIRKISKKTRLW